MPSVRIPVSPRARVRCAREAAMSWPSGQLKIMGMPLARERERDRRKELCEALVLKCERHRDTTACDCAAAFGPGCTCGPEVIEEPERAPIFSAFTTAHRAGTMTINACACCADRQRVGGPAQQSRVYQTCTEPRSRPRAPQRPLDPEVLTIELFFKTESELRERVRCVLERSDSALCAGSCLNANGCSFLT